MNKIIKSVLILTLTLFCGLTLTACNSQQDDVFKAAKVSELNGHTFGVITGSIVDKVTQEHLPLSPIQYYSSTGDTVTALIEKKIDAAILDSGLAVSAIRENDSLTYINEAVDEIGYGAIFNKDDEGKQKRNDFDAFLKQATASGKITYLKNKWLINDTKDKVPYEELTGENGTFTIATDINTYPFVYVYDNGLVGYEVELIYLYCKNRGYNLEIVTTDFGGTLAAVSSGKVDAAFSGIIYSEERAQNYYFTDLYADSALYCLIRKENATSKYNNLDDLVGKTLGIVTGGIVGEYAQKTIKDIKIDYFNSTSDMVEALVAEKVEAIGLSSSTLSTELKNRVDIKVIGSVGIEECGYLFPMTEEGELLRREVNEFMAEAKENGLLDDLDKKWHSDDETIKDIDYSLLTGENGTLEYAVSSAVGEPAAYYKNDHIVGYDIDFIYEFAKAKGYNLNITDYAFTGMLQCVAANMCDLAGSNVTITVERKQTALFSDPLYSADIVVCAYDNTLAEHNADLLTSIQNSFVRTFIKENRYILFIEGILVTLKISFLSIIFGLVFGCLLFAIKCYNNKYLTLVVDKCANLIGEMPTVVLLMIFYYLIFNDASINSAWISIVAFTVYFGFVVEKILFTCLMSIDRGQFEAAYAVGYNKTQVYMRVIIPQLIPLFVPFFVSEVVGLIKATSIVGYIAVQDLTKVSDIVRSRTYEAFFPLIVITIIYILIIKLFKALIVSISKGLNFAKRKDTHILKGVKTRD